MQKLKPVVLSAFGAFLISATPPPVPGEGVLCTGTFIYFVEKSGAQCHAGEDAEFQARIAGYARQFDDYIIRNTGGNPDFLTKFKASQNLNDSAKSYVCEGDAVEIYEHIKQVDAEEMDQQIETMLERDGRPTFGDCV